MKRYRFLPPARAELFEISEHHAAQAAGLGEEFLAVISTSIGLLRENPELGASHRAETRRFVVPRFPYSLIYLDEPSALVFIAVAHHRREPSYWAGRL